MYLAIGGISVFAVIEACRPFTKISTFLCTTTALGYLFAVFLFKNLLHLTPITENILIIFIVNLILAYIFIIGMKTLINNLGRELKDKI